MSLAYNAPRYNSILTWLISSTFSISRTDKFTVTFVRPPVSSQKFRNFPENSSTSGVNTHDAVTCIITARIYVFVVRIRTEDSLQNFLLGLTPS